MKSDCVIADAFLALKKRQFKNKPYLHTGLFSDQIFRKAPKKYVCSFRKTFNIKTVLC